MKQELLAELRRTAVEVASNHHANWNGKWCCECSSASEDGVAWPCDAARLADLALEVLASA